MTKEALQKGTQIQNEIEYLKSILSHCGGFISSKRIIIVADHTEAIIDKKDSQWLFVELHDDIKKIIGTRLDRLALEFEKL